MNFYNEVSCQDPLVSMTRSCGSASSINIYQHCSLPRPASLPCHRVCCQGALCPACGSKGSVFPNGPAMEGQTNLAGTPGHASQLCCRDTLVSTAPTPYSCSAALLELLGQSRGIEHCKAPSIAKHIATESPVSLRTFEIPRLKTDVLF